MSDEVASIDPEEKTEFRIRALRWSETKKSEVEKRATDPTAEARQRVLASVTSYCLRSEHELARSSLTAFLEDNKSKITTDDYLFENLVAVAVTVSQFDLATKVLNLRFEDDWCGGIGVLGPTVEEKGVRWTTHADRTCRFDFCDSIYASDKTHESLLYWARSLSLCHHYVRQPHFVAGSVVINLFDVGQHPGLSFCDNRPGYFLVPDPSFLSLRAYSRTKESFDQHRVAWTERKSIAYWRGGTTGHHRGHWRTLPRVLLCELARSAESFGLIDAGISGIVQMPAKWADEVRESGLLLQAVPPKDYMSYKYQIDIDGNTNAWSGFFERLYTGSPVLKVVSPFGFEQWYYDRLIAWWNYVPVASDMSDLVEKIVWLQSHDAVARKIGERGRSLAALLGFESEQHKSAHTVSAAMKHFAGNPLIEVDFDADLQPGVRFLEGWSRPMVHQRWATGYESRLQIESPIVRGDLRLRADIHTFGNSVEPSAQNLVFAVNGEIAHKEALLGSSTVEFRISDAMRRRSNPMSLVILHPDSRVHGVHLQDDDATPLAFAMNRLSVWLA